MCLEEDEQIGGAVALICAVVAQGFAGPAGTGCRLADKPGRTFRARNPARTRACAAPRSGFIRTTDENANCFYVKYVYLPPSNSGATERAASAVLAQSTTNVDPVLTGDFARRVDARERYLQSGRPVADCRIAEEASQLVRRHSPSTSILLLVSPSEQIPRN